MTFSKEPAAWMGVIRAVLYVATLFGLKLTAEQMAGLVLAVEAITAAITRQSVTPNSKLPKDPPSQPTPRSGSVPPFATGCFLALLAVSCASMSRADRVAYGLKAVKAACTLYSTYPTEVPRQPELDAICPELELAKATKPAE